MNMLLNCCLTSGLEISIVVQLLINVYKQINMLINYYTTKLRWNKLINSWSTVDRAATSNFLVNSWSTFTRIFNFSYTCSTTNWFCGFHESWTTVDQHWPCVAKQQSWSTVEQHLLPKLIESNMLFACWSTLPCGGYLIPCKNCGIPGNVNLIEKLKNRF